MDVYISRNFLDVLFGLKSVGIVALGQPDIHIDGFSSEIASQLQYHLVGLIEEGSKHLEIFQSEQRAAA